MKSITLFIISILLNGCFEMFPKDEHILGSYKMNNNITIELRYIGLGATTKDIIEVLKKTSDSTTLVTKIEGFNDTYKVEMKSIDDTLLKIIFTDTINFKGQSRDFIVNINERFIK